MAIRSNRVERVEYEVEEHLAELLGVDRGVHRVIGNAASQHDRLLHCTGGQQLHRLLHEFAEIDCPTLDTWGAGVVEKRLERAVESLQFFVDDLKIARVETTTGAGRARGFDQRANRGQWVAEFMRQSAAS
ncbi:MAG: hypothetical protein R3B90_17300 [Planctomycetaceae bacterium]